MMAKTASLLEEESSTSHVGESSEEAESMKRESAEEDKFRMVNEDNESVLHDKSTKSILFLLILCKGQRPSRLLSQGK